MTTINFTCQGMQLSIEAAKPEAKNRTFNMVAYTGGPMRVAGWYDPVVVDLSGLAISAQAKPIFFGHEQDLDSLVGQTNSIKVADGQLLATGDILGESDRVKQILTLADKGFKWQASIGARAEKSERLSEDQTAKVNGRQVTGPAMIIRKATLGEISFVMLGADDQTSAQIAANKHLLQEILDLPKDDVKPTQEVAAAAAAQVPDVTAEIRAKAAAELTRIADVRKAAAGNADIEAKAVAEGWTVDKTKLAVLEANLAKAPAVHTEVRLDAKMIEAAACLSAKMPEQTVLKAYGEQATNQAEKYRNIGIHDLFRLIARAEGRELPQIMGDANGFIRAAFSTVSLPNILSNIANKMLLEAYLNQENSWRKVVKIASVNDFKTHSRFRLTDNLIFQKVGADGELKHGKLGEQVFTNKADTSGIMFSLNRQTIINDDLGAFAQIPTMLGIGAADAISDAIWTLILSNPGNFFSAGNNNYAAGANTVLSVDSLTAAELLFLNQTKPNGKPLGILPRYLLVPNALKVTANLLMTSIKLNEAATAGSPKPQDNHHAGKYEVVSSSWLSNATIPGFSSIAWYLFADPARLAAFEVAFLNGNENPTVEQAEADFNTLGIQFRGYIDFGVKEQDYRAAVKMKGMA
jgi:hypothetical protein